MQKPGAFAQYRYREDLFPSLPFRRARGLKLPALAAHHELVQRPLAAKKELALEQELQRLDGYDAVIPDDIGYIQQDREEMEVLFTFLDERYERRSVLLTSNLLFSQWDRIFKAPMTTAAAIWLSTSPRA